MKTLKVAGVATALMFIIILCSSSVWVDLTLMKPGEIALPGNIHYIAIIDRTKQEDTKQNKVEQVLTGEAFRQDEQVVRQYMEGFINGCSSVNKYQIIRTSERSYSDGTKTTFPAALSWDTVDMVCKKYNVDALFSVEIFDSDFLISNKPFSMTRNAKGEVVPVFMGFHVTGVAVINIGIRIYDPVNRIIADEFRVTHRMNWESNGVTLQDAINQLLDKTEAVNKASYEAGQMYANRITPSYYTVTRYFYDKPKRCQNLRAGVRKSEVADWKGAIDSWMLVVQKEKRKFAGRAAFNIAVGYEVLGDLQKAKEWAAKAYTEYEDKEASNYFKIICDRIDEEKLVEQQMSGE